MTPSPAPPPRDGAAGDRDAPSWRRRAFYVVASLWILAAPFYVEASGTIEYSPGFATSTGQLVDLAVDGELHGSYSLLAIHVRVPTLAEYVRALVDDTRELQERDAVIPPSLRTRDYFAAQRANFADLFEVAAAVGLERAGFDVTALSSVGVAGVVDLGPADGLLHAGDRITAVDGAEVAGIEDLVARLERSEPGEEVVLDVLRTVPDAAPGARDADPSTDAVEERREIVVVLDIIDEASGRAGLGITGSTLVTGVELPVEANLDNRRRIGGPSAGLVFGLTVYDLASDEDLARGRRIHATGTLDASGRVGRIGGLRQKVATAAAEDADVLLVPSSQLAEARAYAPDDLEVVGVATFEDALEALRR